MPTYKQVNDTVDVPKGTGVEGFLVALRGVLRLSRLQEVRIDARGRVSFSYFIREEEERQPLPLEFEDVMPYAVIRNGEVRELPFAHEHAATALGQMFQMMAVDHLSPVAFVTGAATWFWRWYKESTNLDPAGDQLFGVPVFSDRQIEDSSLILCASYGQNGSLVDTVRSYKITIPKALG